MRCIMTFPFFILALVAAVAHAGHIDDSAPSGSMGATQDYASIDFEQILKFEKQPGITPPLGQIRRPNDVEHVNTKWKGFPGEWSPAMGSPDAPVEVIVFSDFQCPNCRRVVEPLKLLVRKYFRDVRVVFKQYPLDTHKLAEGAAIASCAAGRLDKFWEFHDLLFQNMRALGNDDLRKYARKVGVDLSEWQKLLNDRSQGSCFDQVRYEKSAAQALDISGTPAFVINGKQQVGWASYGSLEGIVMRALNDARATGPPKEHRCESDGFTC